MDLKKKDLKSDTDHLRYTFNRAQIETLSLQFLEICCEFYDLFEKIKKKSETDPKMNKTVRRQSIQKVIVKEQNKMKKRQSIIKLHKDQFNFAEESFNGARMSFASEDHSDLPNFNKMNSIFEGHLSGQGLDTTIAFIMTSSDEEDQEEIDEFAEQINSEFMKKDFNEIWKDFNNISLFLFSKNLKDVVHNYRSCPEKFKEVTFNKKSKEPGLKTYESIKMSNRILSHSLHLESNHLRNPSNLPSIGKETQFNMEMAEIYREQYKISDGKDKLIEYLIWGFFGSSILILSIFCILFYCNVFSNA